MSLVGTWVETKDGMILEVTKDEGDFVTGIEVLYEKSAPLRYGEGVSVKRNEVIVEENV